MGTLGAYAGPAAPFAARRFPVILATCEACGWEYRCTEAFRKDMERCGNFAFPRHIERVKAEHVCEARG